MGPRQDLPRVISARWLATYGQMVLVLAGNFRMLLGILKPADDAIGVDAYRRKTP